MAMGNGLFLKIPANETVRLRIASDVLNYAKTFPGDVKASKRAACVVIKKEKVGDEIKRSAHVYEFGPSIYNALVELNTKADWGDPTGYDIEVSRTGSGATDTRYRVTPCPKSKLTAEDERLASEINLKEAVEYDEFADEA